MIGLGTQIRDVAEFNRRALPALRALVHPGSLFITDMIRLLAAGRSPTPKQQQAIYDVVHSHRSDQSGAQRSAATETCEPGTGAGT